MKSERLQRNIYPKSEVTSFDHFGKMKNSEIASCFNHLSACHLWHKNLSGIISNVLSKTTSNFEIGQTKQTSLKYQFNAMLTVIDLPVPCL